jgi:hypothetical protein
MHFAQLDLAIINTREEVTHGHCVIAAQAGIYLKAGIVVGHRLRISKKAVRNDEVLLAFNAVLT